MRVGFIGLGRMGSAMAERVLAAGHPLTVYNRTAARAEPLAALGAQVARTPAEAVRGAEAVITMLADDAALEQVVFGADGVLGALPRGAVHFGASTIGAACAQRLTVAHADAGQRYVSGPVFGRPEAARAGKLNVVLAGPDDALRAVEPLCAAIGQRTYRFGSDPQAANVVKLAGNFLLGAMVEALSEAFTLVRKSSIDVQAFSDLLTTSMFDAPAYHTYTRLLLAGRDAEPSFTAALGLKDVRLALAAAEAAQVPMPIASVVHDVFVSALARGYGERDLTVLGRVAAENAGLD
jgi:3-hydroxyisobutyrate dehydrogenase-like beta-hydroxyacid dehydrogenase